MVLQNPNVTGHISEESPYWQIIAVSKTCQVVCGADCRRPAIANTSRQESKTRRKSLDKNYTKCSCSSVHNYNEHRRNVFLRSPRREGHARTKSYLAGVRYNNLVGTTYISCARDATFFLACPCLRGLRIFRILSTSVLLLCRNAFKLFTEIISLKEISRSINAITLIVTLSICIMLIWW